MADRRVRRQDANKYKNTNTEEMQNTCYTNSRHTSTLVYLSVIVAALTLFCHWATCHSFSQWRAQQPRGSQSVQSRNPLSHFHHKPPWKRGRFEHVKENPKNNPKHHAFQNKHTIWFNLLLSLLMQSSGHVKHSGVKQQRRTRRWAYLAGKDVSERREGVVESLVVDGLVQVLDEDVSHPTFPQWGVTLRPHDAEGSAFDHIKIHGVQGSFSWKETIKILRMCSPLVLILYNTTVYLGITLFISKGKLIY